MNDPIGDSGPFGIGKDIEWAWDFYVKPGKTPTDEQFQLAVQLSELAGWIKDTGRDNVSQSLMDNVTGLFSAALVNKVDGNLTHYKGQADSISKELFNGYLTNTIQRRLTNPILFISVVATLLIIMSLFYKKWAAAYPEVLPAATQSIFLMISGTLFGRIFYFGATYLETIKSMEQFRNIVTQTSRIYIMLIFDIVVSSIAFVLFSSGFLVVTIGATEGKPGSGISSLLIPENGMIAVGFGILVGIARTEFIKKIREVAKSGAS
jgi:hypothetical protein